MTKQPGLTRDQIKTLLCGGGITGDLPPGFWRRVWRFFFGRR